MKNPQFDAIFFDLDGTLLDTGPDLYLAMMKTLEGFGHPTISYEKFRPHLHTGTDTLIHGSIKIEHDSPHFLAIRKQFLENYERAIHNETDFFPGMSELLDELDAMEFPWGIVTNKNGRLSKPLIASLRLTHRCRCLISGDTLSRCKPDPAPLIHACDLLGVDPARSIYVGDTESDVKAAKAANMTSVTVPYGYRHPDTNPTDWNTDHLANHPSYILKLITG